MQSVQFNFSVKKCAEAMTEGYEIRSKDAPATEEAAEVSEEEKKRLLTKH